MSKKVTFHPCPLFCQQFHELAFAHSPSHSEWTITSKASPASWAVDQGRPPEGKAPASRHVLCRWAPGCRPREQLFGARRANVLIWLWQWKHHTWLDGPKWADPQNAGNRIQPPHCPALFCELGGKAWWMALLGTGRTQRGTSCSTSTPAWTRT